MNKLLEGAIKNLSRPLAGILIIFALFASVSQRPAIAGHVDWKVYPGSMCVKWAGTGVPVYDFSSIGNNSTTGTLYVDCPAINEYSSGTYLGEVRSTKRNSSANLSCTFHSVARNTDGTILQYWTSGSTYDSSKPVQSTVFTGVGGYWASHYYYSCRIPPKYQGNVSYIHTYRVQE